MKTLHLRRFRRELENNETEIVVGNTMNRLTDSPILNLDSWQPAKVLDVVGYHHKMVGNSCSAYQGSADLSGWQELLIKNKVLPVCT